MKSTSAYCQAATLGLIAGMRAMMAPAFAAYLLNKAPRASANKSTQWLGSKTAGGVATILAIGEVVGDKLPTAPNRTSIGGLTGRVITGSLAGAAVCKVKAGNPLLGALIGASAAVASTYAFFYLRKSLTDKRYINNVSAGAVEDAVAIGTGITLLLT